MSEINKIKHRQLAVFRGIPLYEPLESGTIWNVHKEDGPNIHPGCLVVGGGLGEHPALILHDIDYAVARYLVEWLLPHEVPEEINRKAASTLAASTVEYASWMPSDHIKFRAICGGEGTWDGHAIEEWVLANVGCFIFHAFPDFNPRIKAWRASVPRLPEPFYQAVYYPFTLVRRAPWLADA